MSITAFFRQIFRSLLVGPRSKQRVSAPDFFSSNKIHINSPFESASWPHRLISETLKPPHTSNGLSASVSCTNTTLLDSHGLSHITGNPTAPISPVELSLLDDNESSHPSSDLPAPISPVELSPLDDNKSTHTSGDLPAPISPVELSPLDDNESTHPPRDLPAPAVSCAESAVPSGHGSTQVSSSPIAITSCVEPSLSYVRKIHQVANYPTSHKQSDIQLSDEQQHIVDLILSGRNVFYTGAAGTGKSAVLHAVVARLREKGRQVVVTAPTGKSAFNVNGMTTWRFVGWSPEAYSYPLDELCRRSTLANVNHYMQDTDVLIIDEVSMVENHHFERLSKVMAHYRAANFLKRAIIGSKKSQKRNIQQEADKIRRMPFGGCQVVATGDFFQLPPVLPFQNCITCGHKLEERAKGLHLKSHCPLNHGSWTSNEKWAFSSKAWKAIDFTHIELKTVFRQKGDTKLLDILNRFRIGTFTDTDINTLMDPKRDANRPDALKNAIRLFPTKFEVSRFNNLCLQKLLKKGTPSLQVHSLDTFRCRFRAYPHLKRLDRRLWNGTLEALNDHRFEPFLHLVVGMPVILLTNLCVSSGLINGAHGTIIDFCKLTHAEFSEKSCRLYNGYAEDQVMQFMEEIGMEFFKAPVVQFESGNPQTILPECLSKPLIYEVEAEKHRIRSLNLPEKELSHRLKTLTALGPPVLSRTQFPLAPGWAMSIHKSQGLTLGNVAVDLTKSFAEGQVYVALSRATSLSGLRVEGSSNGLSTLRDGNPEVRDFYRQMFGSGY